MARGKAAKPGMVQVVLHRLHPGQQAIVAHPARFKVVMCGRRFGKTAMGIRLACDTAIAGKKVGWFSPTHKYALEVWRELLSRLGPIIAVKSEQDKRIELVSGGVIEIWTFDTDDPARGRKYHRVIVDEAGLVSELERVWQAAIRLTLVDYSGDALFLGTPKGRQHGFVVLFAKGQGGHPDWHSFRTSTLDNPYIPASEIEEARRDMPPAIFAQEIEGIPADDGGNPFGQTAIAAITRPTMPDADIPEHMPVVWGWDLARAQDWTVGVALDGLLRLLLRAHEEHGAAVLDRAAHEPVGGVDATQRLLEVDDVDAVALAEDESAHLRVPAAGLVAEVNSGLQEVLHGNDGHVCAPFLV